MSIAVAKATTFREWEMSLFATVKCFLSLLETELLKARGESAIIGLTRSSLLTVPSKLKIKENSRTPQPSRVAVREENFINSHQNSTMQLQAYIVQEECSQKKPAQIVREVVSRFRNFATDPMLFIYLLTIVHRLTTLSWSCLKDLCLR